MCRRLLVRGRLALLLLLLAGTGCDSGASPLASVHGRVLFRNVPLHTGTIVFTPDSLRGSVGPSARGQIGPDGSYSLQTDEQPGAIPGWHRVTIVAMDSATGPSGGEFMVPRSLLPEKYRDPEQSGLVCEIKAGQENCISFNVD